VLPHFLVDAVVEAPMGAFPHECYGRYEADFDHFDEYVAAIRRDGLDAVAAYLDRNVHRHPDFAAFLDSFGGARLQDRRDGAAELVPR
jgi:glutaconate CoA-transferase subunit A